MRRRQIDVAPEQPAEESRVLVADLVGDGLDRLVADLEHLLRFFQPQRMHVLERRHPGESLKVPAHVWRAAFQGFLEDDIVGELGRIRVPTMIAWGTRDVLSPRADQEALLAEIAGARLVVYLGAGHGLHWEESERFAADVAGFAANFAVPDKAAASTRR